MSSTDTKPKRKFAADFDGNPQQDEIVADGDVAEPARAAAPSAPDIPIGQIFAVVFDWARRHPKFTAGFLIFFAIWLFGVIVG